MRNGLRVFSVVIMAAVATMGFVLSAQAEKENPMATGSVPSASGAAPAYGLSSEAGGQGEIEEIDAAEDVSRRPFRIITGDGKLNCGVGPRGSADLLSGVKSNVLTEAIGFAVRQSFANPVEKEKKRSRVALSPSPGVPAGEEITARVLFPGAGTMTEALMQNVKSPVSPDQYPRIITITNEPLKRVAGRIFSRGIDPKS